MAKNRRCLHIGALLVLVLLVAGCSRLTGRSKVDLASARRFDPFPLYWVGERFERWNLTSIQGLDGPADVVTLIYGTCTLSGGEQPSCAPPLVLQVSPLCLHLEVVARAPIWKRRRVRGAPVGTIDSAPVLFTRGAQVKVYRGQGSDSGLAMRALRALRSINRVAPVVRATGLIPAPSPGVLEGSRPCTAMPGRHPKETKIDGQPFTLRTHCGILSAQIDGRLWLADPPLSDGSGNPPPGWGNPSARGTLRKLSTTRAEFRSRSGKIAHFQRASAKTTDPARGCE